VNGRIYKTEPECKIYLSSFFFTAHPDETILAKGVFHDAVWTLMTLRGSPDTLSAGKRRRVEKGRKRRVDTGKPLK
jgi:hypothetical protein